jgi:hypothetical protein
MFGVEKQTVLQYYTPARAKNQPRFQKKRNIPKKSRKVRDRPAFLNPVEKGIFQ